MRKKILTLLFFIVAAAHLIGIIIHNENLQTITKPFLMPVLLFLYAVSVKNVNKWYVLALIFAFFGDVLLMDKENLFIVGIAAFLVTQLVYIKIITGAIGSAKISQKTIVAIPFVLFYGILMYLLKDNLGNLMLPVLIYAAVISMFGMLALLNFVLKRNKEALLLAAGALIFMASDSIIALNSFYKPQSYYNFLIMFTYIIAQYLIYRFMAFDEKV